MPSQIITDPPQKRPFPNSYNTNATVTFTMPSVDPCATVRSSEIQSIHCVAVEFNELLYMYALVCVLRCLVVIRNDTIYGLCGRILNARDLFRIVLSMVCQSNATVVFSALLLFSRFLTLSGDLKIVRSVFNYIILHHATVH